MRVKEFQHFNEYFLRLRLLSDEIRNPALLHARLFPENRRSHIAPDHSA
jgi:hypothetical protein